VSNGASLWAGTFDEEMADLFALQDAISEQVAQALSVELSKEDRTRLVKHYTQSSKAYQLYMKGDITGGRTRRKNSRRAGTIFIAQLKKTPLTRSATVD
jgi:hypothetical protein